MSQTAPYKISFCTTCKGRLDHLKQTLRQNLLNNADYPHAEFVILDYDSNDGLAQWLKDHFQPEMESGKIRYAHYSPAPDFKMAHAKNMAHRLATGDILCNLDIDNVTGKHFASWLNQQFTQNPDIVIRPRGNSLVNKALLRAPHSRGINGRLALLREHFYTLGGYDERFTGHGNEDRDLMRRAQRNSGLTRVDIPATIVGHAFEHSDQVRIEHLAEKDRRAFIDVRLKAKETWLGGVVPIGQIRKLTGALRHDIAALAEEPQRLFGCVEQGASLHDVEHAEITLESSAGHAMTAVKRSAFTTAKAIIK